MCWPSPHRLCPPPAHHRSWPSSRVPSQTWPPAAPDLCAAGHRLSRSESGPTNFWERSCSSMNGSRVTCKCKSRLCATTPSSLVHPSSLAAFSFAPRPEGYSAIYPLFLSLYLALILLPSASIAVRNHGEPHRLESSPATRF